jgi:hypothetical protein
LKLGSPNQSAEGCDGKQRIQSKATWIAASIAPPPKNDVEHWAVSERLFRLGYGHHNCGCGGTGPLPSRWSQVAEFLEARRQESPAQRLLARFGRK